MKIAVITGSSKGIGFAITEHLLVSGYKVYGLARTHPDILRNNTHYHPIVVDLKDQQALTHILSNLKKQLPQIDLFVGCAGYGHFHELEQFSDQAVVDLLQVNLVSNILLTKHLLPMLRKRQGKCIFIGSEADHTPHKKGTLYCATKFGLRGFVKSLRLECLSSNVAVTLISLGLVDSSFYDTLDFEPAGEQENKVTIAQTVETIDMVLAMKNNACLEELHLMPMKHAVKKKYN